jgi:hypothetical protein
VQATAALEVNVELEPESEPVPKSPEAIPAPQMRLPKFFAQTMTTCEFMGRLKGRLPSQPKGAISKANMAVELLGQTAERLDRLGQKVFELQKTAPLQPDIGSLFSSNEDIGEDDLPRTSPRRGLPQDLSKVFSKAVEPFNFAHLIRNWKADAFDTWINH